jgi:outer membrane protein assembly factor BamB/TolA-binding protein
MDQESLLYLTCLDARGEEVWTTFLGSFQGGNYLGLAGTSSIPLVSGETIYQLSNMGFVAAIDAEDGTILWVSEYPRLTPRGKRLAIQNERRWHPNPVLPVGQNIIVAPQDSPFLLAISSKTGGIAWRTWREDGATLAGADGRACFVVGSDVVAIGHFGADEGRELWRFGLSENAEKATTASGAASPPGQAGLRLSGRALLTKDALLVPCRDALLALSSADGKLLSRTLWDFAGAGGNILLTKNLLAVTNPEGLLVYNHFDDERARVESLPPEPTETLLQRARFHLKNGQMEAGLKDLRSWTDSAPPAPLPNSVLDHLQLDLAEMVYQLSRTSEGAPFSRELLSFRVRLERTPSRKVEAAIDLASELEKEGDAVAAMAALHEALSHDNPATEYYKDGLLRVQSATYLRDRIVALRKATPHPETAFREIDAAARKALLGARNKGTPPSYIEVVRLYPYTPAAAEAYLDLFTGYRDRQSYDQAIKALEGYLKDYPEGKDVLRVKLLIANLLYQTGERREAKERYLALLKENGTGIVEGVDGMGSKESVGQYVEPILKDPGLSNVSTDETPKLKFPIRMSWRSPADLHAANRTFLQPEGVPPAALKQCFFTQSTEVIECRKIEDGLPLWRVYLEMIPGFEFDDTPFGFRFPRTGKRMISGRYVVPFLVLYDDRNLFAIDPLKSTVRWHVPIGSEKAAKASSESLRQLRERFRGVLVTDDGVFASSSQAMVRHWSPAGELVWEKKVKYEPAPYPPSLLNEALFVHSLKGLFIHNAPTGELVGELGANDGLGESSLARPPIELPGGKLLLPYADALKLFDLSERKIAWTYRRPRSTIEEVAYFPEFPEECVVFINRPSNNWPGMVNLSLHDGSELWRYEKFPAKSTSFSVFREENRFYVIHGVDRWQLLALEARRGADDLRPLVEALWPNEIPLGTFYSGPSQRKLHIGGDAVFFPDPNNSASPMSVFDKAQGSSKSTSASPIVKFLGEKGSFSSSIFAGKLILLTDGGDCAFETVSTQLASPEKNTSMDLIWQYLSKPGALESTSKLALQYFREGDRESAINLLNRSLLSEGLLLENGADKRYLLSFMLDGIKEEYMKESIPRITSHRFPKPPSIDGELNDAWDVSTRIRLNTPRNIGTIPGPGQLRDWEGEEDLSAILYTGWDDHYFYFALDVEDDVLHPYDKDAENWKGDCLLIGLDPTGDGGFRQHGDDQLMTLALTVPKRKLDKDKKKKEAGQDEEEDEDESHKPEGLFSVKKKDDDSGAIYEVGLPWSTFSSALQKNNLPPTPGYYFGLSLLLTDDDTGQGATKTLSLNPCHLLPRSQKNSSVWRFIIPSFFPRVTLE